MIVPPFVPPPLELPRNAAEQDYVSLVAFVRRVVAYHSLTVAAVALLAFIPNRYLNWTSAWLLLLVSLIGLSMIRGMVKGKHWEMYGSAILMPVVLVSLSTLAAGFLERGITPWVLLIGPICSTIYVAFCRNDLSYFGLFFLSALGSGFILTLLDSVNVVPPGYTAYIWLGNLCFLAYFTYDLAMITRRRRTDEALGAVIDLYRDSMNFLTYPIRVWAHWRKHRIWSMRLDLGDSRALSWQKVRTKARRLKNRVHRINKSRN